MSFYSEFINIGDLVFDVGANIGRQTQMFFDAGAGRVIAFEPVSQTMEILKSKFSKDRVSFEQIALGAEPGESVIKVSSTEPTIGINSMAKRWIASVKETGRFGTVGKVRLTPVTYWDREERVSVFTLDQMIEKHGVPAYVKIDVEGFEYEVLLGLSQKVAALEFEFTPERISDAFNVLERLHVLGFTQFCYDFDEKFSRSHWTTLKGIQEFMQSQRNDFVMLANIFAK